MGVKQIATHGRTLAPRHFWGASNKSKWLLIKSTGPLHLNLWHGGGRRAPVDNAYIYIYTLHYMAIYIHSQGHLPKTKLSLVVTVLKTKLNLVEEALGSIEYRITHMWAMMKVTNKEHISSASPHHVPFRSSVALFQEAPGLDNKPQLSSMGLTTGAVTEGWWGRWMLMVGIYIYIYIYVYIYVYIYISNCFFNGAY